MEVFVLEEHEPVTSQRYLTLGFTESIKAHSLTTTQNNICDIAASGACLQLSVCFQNVHVSSKQAEASQVAWYLAHSDIVVDQVIH